jgi:hypothetical protein
MNNARAEMYHDLVLNTGSYPTSIARFAWSCPRKVNPADIPLYAGCFPSFYFRIFLVPTPNLLPTHFSYY